MRRLFGSCGGAARQDILITGDADGPLGSEKEQGARATYTKAQKQGVGQKRWASLPNVSKDMAKGDGQTLKGSNRRTGLRNKCYKCDSEYHLAPTCSWRDAPQRVLGSASPEQQKARKPCYSTISTGAPVPGKKADQYGAGEANSGHEQSFATAQDAGGLLPASESDSVVVLETGATDHLVVFPLARAPQLYSAARRIHTGYDKSSL